MVYANTIERREKVCRRMCNFTLLEWLYILFAKVVITSDSLCAFYRLTDVILKIND